MSPSASADLPGWSSVGDGIMQIRLPMTGNPLRYINGYLIDEPDGPTLVDCGWKRDDVFDALQAGLRAAGYALGDVRRLVITHHHFDHYGLAGRLRRAGVPELLMHRLDWERAQGFADHAAFDRIADAWLARNGFAAVPDDDGDWSSRSEVTPPTHLVADGERIGRLEAIWTPGHSPGHLCFYDTHSGRMLTGDHVLDPITPHVGFWVEDRGDPLGDYVASLEKVGARETTGVLPAHGEPFPDLRRRVDEIIAHTAARDAQILALFPPGARRSAGDLARSLPWTRRNRSFDELGAFHQQFAVSETISHLEHLRRRGLAGRDAGAEPIVYYAA